MAQKTIKIGGASGFWGEASFATRQLLKDGGLDFIVFDYLAEITMSIMARARAKDADAGYATDFVTAAMAPNLKEIARQGVRIISNAGGVNPQACATAMRRSIEGAGLDLKVVVITGDDLLVRADELGSRGIEELFSGEAMPETDKIASINAYLGAFAIAAALDKGADIVITGRCVDSAVTLGACIHMFGWTTDQYDLLAAGSLAGHIIECGPQATGGNFTDWRDAGDIANIGYPIVEIEADGRFTVTKPGESTGIVSRGSVGEQMLYEIGDPRCYLLPDVACDFSGVVLEETGEHRVSVTGARGYAPPPTYKVSATFQDGFRAGQLLAFNGFEAREKARALADAALDRSRIILRAMNAPDFDETSVELVGGHGSDATGYQEVTVKVAVRHRDARAVGLFLRELTGLGLATPPGMSVFTGGGRARPSPVVRLFSFALNKDEVPILIDMGDGGETFVQSVVSVETEIAGSAEIPDPVEATGDMVDVPLIELAWARSGDKGDKANIGVMARRAEYLPWIWAVLDEQTVARRFADFLHGDVERFYLPGSHSMNILMHDVLGGGGIASLRNDAQGKGYAQMLLAQPVAVPQNMAAGIKAERA